MNRPNGNYPSNYSNYAFPGTVEARKQIQRNQIAVATERKGQADTDYFWSLVRKPHTDEIVPRRAMLGEDENQLFRSSTSTAEITSTSASEDASLMDIYDQIPVERSGEGADAIPVLTSFEELRDQLPEYLYRNILLMQYSRPTPIQRHSIPLGLAGHDLMCCAQTGSGKTFAFLLPVIATLSERVSSEEADSSRSLIDERGVLIRALVLAPTRELASQINNESRKLCNNSSLRSTVVYGGADIRAQLHELACGTDVLVATPGRLLDLVDRGVVSLECVEFLVLNMGFEPQMRAIVLERNLPPKEARRTFMFSATFAPEIQVLAKTFLREYIWVTVGRAGSTVDNITQSLILASSNKEHKMSLLLDAIAATEGRTLIFVQMKRVAALVCAVLNSNFGIRAQEIHGDRSQSQREFALKQFRSGVARVLVATDVAARGLDIPEVTHVIQFDLPTSADDFDTYVHRIGRTGRAGHKGLATSLYVPGREQDGNARIAPLILRLLQENQQNIPDWFLALDDIHDSGQGGGGGRRQPQRGQYSTSGTNFMSRDVRGGPRFTSSQLPRFSMPQNMSYLPQGYSPAPFYPQEGYYNQQNEQQQPTMSAYGGQDSGGYGGHYGQEAFYYSQHQQVSESYEGSEGGAYEEVKFEPSTAAASRASRSYVGIPSTTAPDVTTAYYAAASLSVMQQQRPPQPHGNRMYGNYRGGGADASEMRYTGGQPSPYQQQHYAPQPPPFHRQQPMRAPQYVPSPQQLRGPQPPPPPPRPSSDA